MTARAAPPNTDPRGGRSATSEPKIGYVVTSVPLRSEPAFALGFGWNLHFDSHHIDP